MAGEAHRVPAAIETLMVMSDPSQSLSHQADLADDLKASKRVQPEAGFLVIREPPGSACDMWREISQADIEQQGCFGS